MPALPRRWRVRSTPSSRLRPLLAAAATVLALAACGSSGTTPPTPTGGIDLLTIAGPTCPVQQQGQVCERPISARLTVQDGKGSTVTTVQTGHDGKARVPLQPGSYRVVPQPAGNGFPRAPQAQAVTVKAGAYLAVRLDYDTGIR